MDSDWEWDVLRTSTYNNLLRTTEALFRCQLDSPQLALDLQQVDKTILEQSHCK